LCWRRRSLAGAQRVQPILRGVKPPLQFRVAQIRPAPRAASDEQHEYRDAAEQAGHRHDHARQHEQPPRGDVVFAQRFADKARGDARYQ
jgi:hypothetical protein